MGRSAGHRRRVPSAPALEKFRHALEVEGLIWQVDEYSGGLTGFVTVDVKLPSDHFARPPGRK
jgi:CYTH domain-containing protein